MPLLGLQVRDPELNRPQMSGPQSVIHNLPLTCTLAQHANSLTHDLFFVLFFIHACTFVHSYSWIEGLTCTLQCIFTCEIQNGNLADPVQH